MNLKDFEPRLYQETILATASEKNTLVVLPTGMGKTGVALILAMQRLRSFPNSKVLFLAPTKPLAQQHMHTFMTHVELEQEKFVLFTGEVSPEKRAEQWKHAKMIFSTPQGLENDMISDRIDLRDVSLVVFDEAHRAVGDYSYVFIAKRYHSLANYERILALTASPGSDTAKVKEVCDNLFIESVEVRSEDDPDVSPYVQDVEVSWVQVELPEAMAALKKVLDNSFKEKLRSIKDKGYITSIQINTYSKKDLLDLQRGMHAEISAGNKDFGLLKSVSLLAEAMKVQHAIELLETQGLRALHRYMKSLFTSAKSTRVKAVKNLAMDPYFKTAFVKCENLISEGVEHPKLPKLIEILKDEVREDVKVIVFTQFRDSALQIKEEVDKLPKVSSEIFVGQAKKEGTGLSQKHQKEMLERFRSGEFNVLISTSIGEEGLDIPSVDSVVFYEPIPSAIRHIQRKGRTGRHSKGKVIILFTKNTRDEAYKWSAHHKQRRMYRLLEDIKKDFSGLSKKQTMIERFMPEEKINIYVDMREKGSNVLKELIDMGMKIELKRLEVGDYLLSERLGVELKTVPDFVDSIIDGRLLDQVKNLKENFERPLVMVEGSEDIYSQRNVHPNAIRGMLATIAISYNVPILFSRNPHETASYFYLLAKREAELGKQPYTMHGEKQARTVKEQQEYIVSSIPGIGPKVAVPLLKKFRSVVGVVNSSEEELTRVELIGKKKARTVREVLDALYEDD